MDNRLKFGIAAAIVAVVIVTSLPAGASIGFINTNYNSTESHELRIGYFPNINHAQAVIGLGRRDFQKALGDGIEVKTEIFSAGPSAITALFANQVDVTYIGPNPAISGYVQSDGEALLEANEGMNVGIYDEKGLVKWSFVGAITTEYPPSTFIFEAPFESQQSALNAEFGQRVNLAEVHPDAIASVESQRRGFLSKSAIGVSYLRKNPEGGPAAKFIYFIIKTKHPVEQRELISVSHLPRRTVQAAIDDLKRQGLIIERNSLDDARKKVYQPVQSDWL